ncbi:MAG: RES family NAD+ phosphorylase, partial [Rhizobiales bacterium]|nr:RES family NAD+ phosphorylase [Hyphomicrobiales bacterium]
MSIDGVPVVTEAFPKTVRLVTTARLRAAVLAPLVDDPADLDALAEIEGATSTRLIAEERGISGLAANELVHDVPHAHFINASFAYARPRQPNRFNGTDRGAWYAALDVATCLREVGYHLTSALADAGNFNAVVEYGEMFCSLAG